MLVLKRSLLNRKYSLVIVLKALASGISVYSLHVFNPITKDYTRYFMVDKEDIPSIQCKMSLRGHKSVGKVDDLSLIFNDFYVPVLTPHLSNT
jgi:hypothetical protein